MSQSTTKPAVWTVRLTKTQISLGICPVWSKSSLCALRTDKDPRFHHLDSENSDQTGRIPRLIEVFAGRTGHFFLVLSCSDSNGVSLSSLVAEVFIDWTSFKTLSHNFEHPGNNIPIWWVDTTMKNASPETCGIFQGIMVNDSIVCKLLSKPILLLMG